MASETSSDNNILVSIAAAADSAKHERSRDKYMGIIIGVLGGKGAHTELSPLYRCVCVCGCSLRVLCKLCVNCTCSLNEEKRCVFRCYCVVCRCQRFGVVVMCVYVGSAAPHADLSRHAR